MEKWERGFVKQGDLFLCDNGDDAGVKRGAFQSVVVNGLQDQVESGGEDLMCSDFHKFKYEFVEKYMKCALAYGMFPRMFSPEYSQRSHYFKQPEFSQHSGLIIQVICHSIERCFAT